MSRSATWAPSAVRRSAMAYPIPSAAPVTAATRPCSRLTRVPLSSVCGWVKSGGCGVQTAGGHGGGVVGAVPGADEAHEAGGEVDHEQALGDGDGAAQVGDRDRGLGVERDEHGP